MCSVCFLFLFMLSRERMHRDAERGRCCDGAPCHSGSSEGNCTVVFFYNVRYAVEIMLQAVEGIKYIHRQGVSQPFVAGLFDGAFQYVHGDVKAANMLLCTDRHRGRHGILKLCDFGTAATLEGAAGECYTGGTTGYLSVCVWPRGISTLVSFSF